MTPQDEAFDYFVTELDGYITATMEESACTWDEAVAEAMFEYDEFWRTVKEEYGVE